MVKKQKHEEKSTHTYLIIGPMDFPTSAIVTYKDHLDIRLIFIDGGLRHKTSLEEHFPNAIKDSLTFGDGDSSNKAMNFHKNDQNISDLGFFLRSIHPNAYTSNYHFLGFLGGRLDHMIFNLGELTAFTKLIKSNDTLVLLDDHIQFLCSGENLLCIDGPFSIATVNDNKIKISGECEYTSNEWIKLTPLSSRGLSNNGSGAVVIEALKPLFIIYS